MRGEIRDGFSFWILKNYIDIDRKNRIITGTGQLCESFAQLPRPRDYRDYSIASIALNRPVFQFVAVS